MSELADALERILRGGTLADKLVALPGDGCVKGAAAGLIDTVAMPGFVPVRSGPLAFSQERAVFPKLTAKATAADKAKALHFFANHELLAIELLAYAALKYPDDPPGLHASLLRTLTEEQTHLKMYLERMAELGVALGDFPLNGHFWQLLAPAKDAIGFTCGMNLTFEQANLDFAHYYQQRFAAIGDPVTAKIMATIAEDEISHVSRGVYIVKKADTGSSPQHSQHSRHNSLWAMYREHLPANISPMRAKGTAFDRRLRKKAHIDGEFIGELYAYRESASQPSRLFYYNPDCEREINNPHYGPQSRSPAIAARIRDLDYLLTVVSKPGDAVLVSRVPSLAFRQQLGALGLPVAQPLPFSYGAVAKLNKAGESFVSRNFAAGQGLFEPWGQTPGTAKLAAKLAPKLRQRVAAVQPNWYSKLELPRLRQKLGEQLKEQLREQMAPMMVGEIVTSEAQLATLLATVRHSVIKAPFGAAGSAMFYLDHLDAPKDQTAANFARTWLTAGKQLLWEPRCEVAYNVSAVGMLGDDGEVTLQAFTRFATTAKGQYAGHFLWPAGRDPIVHAAEPWLSEAFAVAGHHLASCGYAGPFGIDGFGGMLDGEPILQPLSEINSRWTMGHIAAVLQRKLAPHLATPAVWQWLDTKALQEAGYRDAAGFAAFAQREQPMVSKGGYWQHGIALLSDWEAEPPGLSVLSVGEKATNVVPFACPLS